MPKRIQLHGGLGNQLFIWAMAKAFEAETKQPVILVYCKDKNARSDRPIELRELLSKSNGQISIHESKYFGYLLKAVDKLSATRGLSWLRVGRLIGLDTMAQTYDLPPTISNAKFFRGFYQNVDLVEFQKESLYSDLSKFLRQISFPDNTAERNREFVLHIRRGDTLNIAKEWGLLDFEYYKRNLNEFNDFTILTDDESYLSDIQAKFPNAEILTPNNCSSWQALKIMANAKHLIMANSTLSWWGAWLLTQNGGTCTFPYPWRPGDIDATKKLIFSSAMLGNSDF